MIQRIQTVYLLGVFLAECLMLFLPWVEYTAAGVSVVFQPLCLGAGCQDGGAVNTLSLAITLLVCIALTVYTITRYKDRKLQIKLVRWNMLALLFSTGVFSVFHYMAIGAMQAQGELSMHYRWVVALPAVALVLLWMALKGIRKDEELIRSVDRLR